MDLNSELTRVRVKNPLVIYIWAMENMRLNVLLKNKNVLKNSHGFILFISRGDFTKIQGVSNILYSLSLPKFMRRL